MTESVPDAAVQTITYKRQAHQKKQADLLAAYPVRKELLFIPAQIKRLDHIQHAYKCLYCSSKNLNDKIIKAVMPKAPLNHSLGSASIIAHTLYQKYEMKVPDYRQESYWRKMGLNISRQHLNNWRLKSTEYYFKPMYDLLKTKLLTQPVLHADETYYRVLESETAKSYYFPAGMINMALRFIIIICIAAVK